MIKAVLIFFISALSISASTNYPDDVNKIVRDRIFVPMENCLPQSILDSIRSGQFEYEDYKSYNKSDDIDKLSIKDSLAPCFFFPYNYLNTDSIYNLINLKTLDYGESLHTISTYLADRFLESFIDFIKANEFDVRPIIDTAIFYGNEFSLSPFKSIDLNDTIKGKYIPKDFYDAVSYLDKLPFDSTAIKEFMSYPEELAIFREVHQKGSIDKTLYDYLLLYPHNNRFYKNLNELGLYSKYDSYQIKSIFLKILYRKNKKIDLNISSLLEESQQKIKEQTQYNNYPEKIKQNKCHYWLLKAYSLIEDRKREQTNSSITPKR